jgi:hypothetical protein
MNTTCERQIQITKRFHRGEWRIFFGYEYNTAWNNKIRKIPGVRYSASYKAWHVPSTMSHLHEFIALGLPYILPGEKTGTAAQPRKISASETK